MSDEQQQCGTHCAQWSKKAKRCPKGAVSAKAKVDQCILFIPKR